MSVDSTITSRRALLAGAFGGVAAWAAATAVKADPTRAAAGDAVRAGQTTTAGGATTTLSNNSNTNHTLVVVQNGRSTAIRADANAGVGGRFKTGGKQKWALVATNSAGGQGEGSAILAKGGFNTGVLAYSEYIAVSGQAVGGVGVYGLSQTGAGISAFSISGPGLECYSSNGFAAQVNSHMKLTGYFEVQEINTDAPVPSDHNGRIFMRDSGTGKTQLCVRFPTGAVQVIAAEP